MVAVCCPPHGRGLRLARDAQGGLSSSSSGSLLSSVHLGNGDRGCSIVLSGVRPSWHLHGEMKLSTGWLCWATRGQKVGGSVGEVAVGSGTLGPPPSPDSAQ